jgi:hypothetical protein
MTGTSEPHHKLPKWDETGYEHSSEEARAIYEEVREKHREDLLEQAEEMLRGGWDD